MILKNPKQLTSMEIWAPRYSSAYSETKERVALLACYKVDNATPVILVEFTKAKHLAGQRFCIYRHKAIKYPIDSNGKIPCYAVPMSAFEGYDTVDEIKNIVDNIFEE